MSSPLEVIKSYLVSLGFSVDKNSYDTATRTIESAGESLSKFAGDTVKNFGVAGATVTSFLATAAVGIGKFLSGLGEAQIQYEMLARQMWTTQENAEAFNTTLKAMGVSLQELYLSPTLMKQYQELHAEAFQMMPPSDFQKQISLVQSITFEFKRMKLEATYSLQWIGYYFIKYMHGPLTSIHQLLQKLNDSMIKGMPTWTKVIAQVMVWVTQLFGTVVQTFQYAWKAITDLFNMIPKKVKEVGAVFLALGVLIKSGPVGIIIGLLLLLNDFYTYLKGGHSEFAPLWAGIMGFYDRLKDSSAFKAFKKGFKDAMDVISNAIPRAKQAISDFWKTLNQNGTINNIEKTFSNGFGIISKIFQDLNSYAQMLFRTLSQSGVFQSLGSDIMQLIKSVSDLFSAITGLINNILGLKSTNSVFKTIGQVITDTILVALKLVDTSLKEIITLVNTITDIFQGKWSQVWKNIKSMLTGSNLASSTSNQSYIYPSGNTNHSTNNNQQLQVNQTNNIYGSNPTSTAKAATSNLQDLIYRNIQGVIL